MKFEKKCRKLFLHYFQPALSDKPIVYSSSINQIVRAPYKSCIFISITPLSLPNPILNHLLKSSHRDDSNKWSNIEIGKEITQVVEVEDYFTHLIWSSDHLPHSSEYLPMTCIQKFQVHSTYYTIITWKVYWKTIIVQYVTKYQCITITLN